MENIINHLAIWLDSSKYILLFLGCIVEGPVVMMTSGFLFSLGQFNFVPMYVALVLGDFTADIMWYCIGRFGTRKAIFKYGHFLGITPLTLEKVEERFNKYHQKILIISKLTMGFGLALVVLISAGIFKVPFKNYVVLNLVGGFIWTAFLLTVGYFLGNIFNMITGPMKVVFIGLVIIIFIIGIKYVNRYFNKNGM